MSHILYVSTCSEIFGSLRSSTVWMADKTLKKLLGPQEVLESKFNNIFIPILSHFISSRYTIYYLPSNK